MRERHFFRSFQSYVFDYENFSDDEINALVVAGMAYRDDEILMNVLAGIAYEAMEALSNDGTPNRNIDAIPGFKEQLISLIRAGLEDDSWIEAKIIPPWWLGYIPLAVYFSTDTDVENLIVDSISLIPSAAGDFLEFFTIGGFRSERVQSLRFTYLQADAPNVASKAARGIEATMPEGGLGALEVALTRRDAAIVDIFEAIAVYRDKALGLLPMLEAITLELVDYRGTWRITPIDHQRMQAAVDSLKGIRGTSDN